MRLKKMEIFGFKSFYDKAVIEFPEGVSAIVGPNGCGKSNVVDALRWAMGEQSVKQLRGKSMEDIIFAGTSGKSPLNMAEVSLILANDNGSCPEEFRDLTEIMLTRRLFRSGESAYLINKRPGRLKDIRNIFLGSGMGSRSYSVIQQGNIGAITDAGPEERRRFIEEAAGVTRYKTRKKEAERKLDATNQNLLRANDIITEISRQMKGLDRQAKKAERYKKYQAKIKDLDVQCASFHYDRLTQDVYKNEELLTNLRNSDMEQAVKLHSLDASVETIRLELSEKSEKLARFKSDRFKIRRDTDKLENDMNHLEKEISRLAEESSALEGAGMDLAGKNEKILQDVSQIEQENETIQKDLDATKKLLEKENEDSAHIREKSDALNQTLENVKAEHMKLIAREAEYKNIFLNASGNKENLKRRLKRTDEEAAIARNKVSTITDRERQCRIQLESAQQEISYINSDIDKIKKNLDETNIRLTTRARQTQTIDLERKTLSSQYQTLKKIEENFEGYQKGVQAIMKQKARSTELPDAADISGTADPDGLPDHTDSPNLFNEKNIICTVADIIESEPEFEMATEAALGETLQYILIDSSDTGLTAIDFLKSSNKGRSGFVPLSVSCPGINSVSGSDVKPIHEKEIPGPNRELLRYIKVKPEFEHVARALTGHIRLAETLEEALSLVKEHEGLTFVTLSGDIVTSTGIMSGGSSDHESGILARKQQIRNIEKQIAGLDNEYQAAKTQLDELESQAKGIEARLEENIESKDRLIDERNDAEKECLRIGEELKHANRHLNMIQAEQDQLADEETDMDDEIEKHSKAIESVTEEIGITKKQIAAVNRQIDAESVKMEKFDNNIVDLKLTLTSLNTRLENSAGTLKRLTEFQKDGLNRMEQLSKDIELKNRKREAAKLSVIKYREKIKNFYSEMESLDQTIDEKENEFNKIDSSLKENDVSISEIRKKKEEISRKSNEIELELSRKKLERDNVASRIEEKYHRPLTAFMNDSITNSNQASHKPDNIKEVEKELAEYKSRMAKIGNVNLGAIEEYEALEERFTFLDKQKTDLVKAVDDLHKVIRKINKITQERFVNTLNQVNKKLGELFPKLFEGGTASLVMTEPDKPLESGVEFMVHPPGKKLTRLSLLSGGEKALSAIAFIFSIFLIKPASFCIMDEIDAPLDEANVHRFNDLLRVIGEQSQIILITHKKHSMEFADILFGVTMEEKGISKIVSVNLERKEEKHHGVHLEEKE